MVSLARSACLLLITAGLTALPMVNAAATGQSSSPSTGGTLTQLRSGAEGGVRVSREFATGKVDFVRTAGGGDLMPSEDASGSRTAALKATAYVREYADAFGARENELRQTSVTASRYGWTVAFDQVYRGVPVFGGQLKANVDTDGDLTSVSGFAVPGLDLDPIPGFSQEEAGSKAVDIVEADPPGDRPTTGLEAAHTDLAIYRVGATSGRSGPTVLAWAVEVTNGSTIRDMVILDANTNKPVNRYSIVTDGLEREIFEQQYDEAHKVFDEGEADDPDTLNLDQRNIYEGSGEAYWFFENTFGRDSYDGAGHEMQIVNNDPTIQCPNANWNGVTTNYCNGVTSDDVVAHEWAHAYTEHTSGLVYQYQPGAMNEAFSDIWGETIDLVNGRMDDDEGDVETPRIVGACSTHANPASVVRINSPAQTDPTCDSAPATFGPALTATGITDDVMPVADACDPLTPDSLASLIALVDESDDCEPVVQVKNAQDAGAVGVLVGMTEAGEATPLLGSDPTVTISSARISLADRNRIVALEATTPVNVTLAMDSYRWLIGEDSSAFDGAIRDMWSPTCFGSPGKVTDAEYYCGEQDNGGVHANSGVVNHAYALLVDGGTYNGATVEGIGLEKAVALYWQAQTANLVEVSDFTDLANALDASCTAMMGTGVVSLGTTPTSPGSPAGTIEQTDCDQVTAASAAVQLRDDVSDHCDWRPVLQPGHRSVCGAGTRTVGVWTENFSDGLAGWSSVVDAGGVDDPWVDTLTSHGHGRTAYVPNDPSLGDCSGGPGDASGVSRLTSPVITMPATGVSPRLDFDHYVATESGWDGGRVKVSVENGAFQPVPASAFTFNAYNATLLSAGAPSENTNPLAGHQAFSGVDGGTLNGSWGQSQIDLTDMGVGPGDRVRVQFEFGRDGCGGFDGWYVDNVSVTVCKFKSRTTAVHRPQPSKFGRVSKVLVAVRPNGGTGTPTGIVRLTRANGQRLSAETLARGKVTFLLAKRFPVGRTTLVAKYAGSSRFDPSSGRVVVRVQR